jgi:hypothetical protein
MYSLFDSQQTSQFLFLFKPRPLPPRFLTAILNKENVTITNFFFSVMCTPTIISLIPSDFKHLDHLDGQASTF